MLLLLERLQLKSNKKMIEEIKNQEVKIEGEEEEKEDEEEKEGGGETQLKKDLTRFSGLL